LTYSIVARDEKTGEMGVAVQSHYFSVGSVVPWARAGVGAVATQAMVEPRYGPLGLGLMAAGMTAQEALRALLSVDPKADVRQVAIVDSRGNVAAHTGKRCIPYAGHVTGRGVSCQGNIMKNGNVWKEMMKSYERNASMPFPERLVATLEAAEAAGGDARGKQSAAILVVSSEKFLTEWEGKVIELRVEDHPEPVEELKRLLRYQRGYEWVSEGDNLLTSGRYDEAKEAYQRGLELVPEVLELKYWTGLSLLNTKQSASGLKMLKEVFRADRAWVSITKGIIKKRSIPIDPALLKKLFT
jgi:uncharacterized Ntn-hydrolase superfamily protein